MHEDPTKKVDKLPDFGKMRELLNDLPELSGGLERLSFADSSRAYSQKIGHLFAERSATPG